MNHFEAAISDFRKVLELEPGRRDATINIGISLLKKHSLDEAILQFSRALDIFGEDAWIHYLRALAYREKKMSGEAYNDLMKAKQLGYNVSDVDLASMRQK